MVQTREKPKYLRNLLLAFVLGTILFISIFLLGYNISYNKYRNLLTSQEQLRYNLLSFEVEREILGDSCENFDPYLFAGEMDYMGGIIGLLEQKMGKNSREVFEQKKVYSLLEGRHFIYIRDHNARCLNKVKTILFFYSNSQESKDYAERLGYMLTSLKNQEEVMIYSFDYDLDSSFLKTLKKRYNINQPNLLVINENTVLNVFENIEDIKQLL